MQLLAGIRRRPTVLGVALVAALMGLPATTYADPHSSWDPRTPDIVLGQASPGMRYHFPNAVELADGTFVVVAREGTRHSTPDGRLVMLQSTDDGGTWSDARIVHDSAADDRDPMIAQSSSGRLLLSWFQSGVPAIAGTYVAYSDDQGGSWSEPVKVETAMSGTNEAGQSGWASSHGQVTEAPDGTLLIPLYGVRPGDPAWRASVVRSLDDGRTWKAQDETFIPVVEGTGVSEPVLTTLPSGEMTALLRDATTGVANLEKRSQLSRSFDSGRTWSPAVHLDLKTSSADTIVLSNGDVFLAYGDLSQRFSHRRLTAATVITDPSGPWTPASSSPVWDAFVDDQANPAAIEVRPGEVMVFGFDYNTRSLVATSVDVNRVGRPEDADQLRGRLDLSAMVESGQVDIDTDLTATDPSRPGVGPTAAIDGVLGVPSSAMGGQEVGHFTLTFDTPMMVREVGVALRPGEPQSAVVEVAGPDGTWHRLATLEERYRSGHVDWTHVTGQELKVRQVRVSIEPAAGTRPPNSGARPPLMLSELAVRGHRLPTS